jgi:hypothetical protein
VNRRLSIEALKEIGGDNSVSLLRKILKNEIKPRVLPEDEEVKPAELTILTGKEIDENGCTEQAYAALILAELRDKESFSFIKGLKACAKGADKIVLEKAVKLIKN